MADKDDSRITTEGAVECYLHQGANLGTLVEVNCRTDFAARTEEFRSLVLDIAMHIAAMICAMKPLDGTFVDNAQAHGVAGLNVDGSRTSQPKTMKSNQHAHGRWPANLLLDPEAAARLDGAAGDRPTGGSLTGNEPSTRMSGEIYGTGIPLFDVREDTEVRCKHPTVKPLSVCEWLVRLAMMPENTKILDPFAGTAQIGIACQRLGAGYEGIEIDPEHHAWATEKLRRNRHRQVA